MEQGFFFLVLPPGVLVEVVAVENVKVLKKG
jgi:hypothetical protein